MLVCQQLWLFLSYTLVYHIRRSYIVPPNTCLSTTLVVVVLYTTVTSHLFVVPTWLIVFLPNAYSSTTLFAVLPELRNYSAAAMVITS